LRGKLKLLLGLGEVAGLIGFLRLGNGVGDLVGASIAAARINRNMARPSLRESLADLARRWARYRVTSLTPP
jgi:hypothetical protein